MIKKMIREVAIKDPMFDLQSERYFGVFKGAKNNIIKRFPADSNDNSQSSWDITALNKKLVYDRQFNLQMKVRFTLTGVDDGVPLIQTG